MEKPYFNRINCLQKIRLSGFALIYSRGSVLVMGAILLPVVMLFSGAVADLGRAFACKAEINRACMIAAEEATKEINMEIAQFQGENSLTDNSYEEIITNFFYANLSQRQHFTIESLSFEVFDSSDNPKYIEINCTAAVDCFFLQMIGISNIRIHSKGCGRLKRLSAQPLMENSRVFISWSLK